MTTVHARQIQLTKMRIRKTKKVDDELRTDAKIHNSVGHSCFDRTVFFSLVHCIYLTNFLSFAFCRSP